VSDEYVTPDRSELPIKLGYLEMNKEFDLPFAPFPGLRIQFPCLAVTGSAAPPPDPSRRPPLRVTGILQIADGLFRPGATPPLAGRRGGGVRRRAGRPAGFSRLRIQLRKRLDRNGPRRRFLRRAGARLNEEPEVAVLPELAKSSPQRVVVQHHRIQRIVKQVG